MGGLPPPAGWLAAAPARPTVRGYGAHRHPRAGGGLASYRRASSASASRASAPRGMPTPLAVAARRLSACAPAT
eukprot:976526-Alexandrium_andersonii.AAC.1